MRSPSREPNPGCGVSRCRPALDGSPRAIALAVRAIALAVALVLFPGAAWAQDATCAELADAGVPGPAVRVEPGYVVESPAWLVPPARMCRVGEALSACESKPVEPSTGVLVAVGGGSAAVAVAVVLLSLWASGHLR